MDFSGVLRYVCTRGMSILRLHVNYINEMLELYFRNSQIRTFHKWHFLLARLGYICKADLQGVKSI